MFTCCSLPFSTEADLTAHLWSPDLHRRGNYSCGPRCGASFRSGPELAQHRRQDFHLKPPITTTAPFRCTVCEVNFRNMRDLDDHMDDVIHNIPCHWCAEIQINQYESDSHLLRYHRDMLEQRPGTVYPAIENRMVNSDSLINCDFCDDQFCWLDSYKAHLIAHLEARTGMPVSSAYCNSCSREFSTHQDLDQHNSAVHAPSASRRRGRPVHPQPSAIPCLQCDRTFGTQQALQHHRDASHNGLFLPRTAPPAIRRNQVAAPPPLAQFPCRTCPGVFPTQVSLTQHTTTAHPARARAQFSCSMCSKTFINQYALDQHMASAAHPEYVQQGRRMRVYKCEECPRTFEMKDMLTLHAATHVTQRLGRR